VIEQILYMEFKFNNIGIGSRNIRLSDTRGAGTRLKCVSGSTVTWLLCDKSHMSDLTLRPQAHVEYLMRFLVYQSNWWSCTIQSFMDVLVLPTVRFAREVYFS